ncbi:hypothetical protein [Streptomyces sp. NPDC050507]|uniref:hypothetical protein n=1 Tax=Streptomyces sp. NPDC050507 TaxID=3365619 RepID=UPI0037A3E953
MEAEVLAGLIGFGGAVFGAVIGGGTSLIATKLTLNHQRDQTSETRLQELGHAATETAMSELIQLGQFLGSIRGAEVEAHVEDNRPWITTAGDHLKNVELAVARIPDRKVRDRVKIPLDLAYRYRASGSRHFFAVRWVGEMANDMIDVLSANLRRDKMPALPESVTKAQEKVTAYDERIRLRQEALIEHVVVHRPEADPPTPS